MWIWSTYCAFDLTMTIHKSVTSMQSSCFWPDTLMKRLDITRVDLVVINASKKKNMKYVPDKSPSAIINEILFGDEELTLSDISSDDWSEFSTDWHILLVYLILICRLRFTYKFIFCSCYASEDRSAFLFWFVNSFYITLKQTLPAVLKNLLLV